ncbi:MAG: tRNA (adenosine(37)-N6)-threonylcarbamoyltransferase complex dimerization subunit type 1 TsaB [Selenomonadaceae bacterium]|nr:tRNA (adenosine(37)-N6)-threonylcarbamoyltransferase complex dimerization subunit type 1 TsaB [Selenomonadaceae bacterium]
MSILALETATRVSGVAVADIKSGVVLAEIVTENALTHSETLMPQVAEVLNMAKLKRENLKAVAVSIGPGSFTGLRIGLATAKAIAYGLNIPLVGVPTTEVLAAHFPLPKFNLLPLLDAQKKRAYCGRYRWEQGELTETAALAIHPVADIINFCADWGEPVIIMGDAVGKYILGKTELPPSVIIPPAQLLMPRAANLAYLGIRKLKRGARANPMTLEPLYLRPSEAELLWEKRRATISGK